MQHSQIRELAERLLSGHLSLEGFLGELARPKTADLGEIQLDLDRRRRCGYPEVVYGEGKTLASLEKIFNRLISEGVDVLATRVAPDAAQELSKTFPTSRYNAVARTLRISVGDWPSKNRQAEQIREPLVAVVSAGTSDLPVAEEARETLDWMGISTVLVQDVGVAGPHRLPEQLHRIENADAVVVVAGMEGALPSVVGGYVACPVIAVPTSIGYGASCGGLAALFSMLNSCAANVTVVNVDAGFKAGYVAGLIAGRAVRKKS
jgi:pyridinium-3,5-biscarboxylic acid mononucleotide synthase